HLRRHAVQLGEVERLDAEPAQRRLGGRAQTDLGVVVGVELAGAAQLGGDKDVATALAQKPSDQALAASRAVNVGGIEKVDTRVGRAREDGEAVGFIDRAPVGAAELPAAQADFGNVA